MSMFMTFISGADRGNKQPLGGVVPGSNLIAQLYGLCGGNEVAQTLLNTYFRSWYVVGTLNRLGYSSSGLVVFTSGTCVDRRQEAMHAVLHPMILPVCQLMSELQRINQGMPRTGG